MIGPRGGTIAEILQQTGVSVEMPPGDSATGTIILRGPHEKLGIGKTNIYSYHFIFTVSYQPILFRKIVEISSCSKMVRFKKLKNIFNNAAIILSVFEFI